MKRYTVTWICDSSSENENPLEALRKAIENFPYKGKKQKKKFGLSRMFDVTEMHVGNKKGITYRIDITNEGCNPFNEENIKDFNRHKAFSTL